MSEVVIVLTAQQIEIILLQLLNTQIPFEKIIKELQERTQVADVREYVNLLLGDKGIRYVAERIALAQLPRPKLDRAGLIELVNKIMTARGSEAEIETWIDWVIAETSCHELTNLIFYPNEPEPTAEAIVNQITQ